MEHDAKYFEDLPYDYCETTTDQTDAPTSVELQTVTVKFCLPEHQIIAQNYTNCMTIGEIKKDIAGRFEVFFDALVIGDLCGKEIDDDCPLYKMCPNEFGIYEFLVDVRLSDKGKPLVKLCIDVYNSKHRLPDFITVHIPAEETESGKPKDIVVEIENSAIVKPYLCGYRNKCTGIEYHDAFTQTGPYLDKWKHRKYISKDTQTYETVDNGLNTSHDKMIQCWVDDNNVLFISEPTDYIIVAKKYETYAQKMRREKKLEKIILIQRNWRRYLFTEMIKKVAAEHRRLVNNRLEEEENYKKELAERVTKEERAKLFPHTADDFDLLFLEVQNWKKAELKKVAQLYDGPARIAEVSLILDKEVQMINNIEKQRMIVHKALQDYREQKLLTKLGEPIKWYGYRDTIIYMDLLRTQRVRFLHQVFNDLKAVTEKCARLDLLRKVKEIVCKEPCFPEFPNLYDLFDREYNLLIYTQYCDVEVLRKRQNLLFMEFIKWSEDHEEKQKPSRMCEVCKKVKPYSQFSVIKDKPEVTTCKACYYLRKGSTDNIIYGAILRGIQREERKRRCNRSIAFVLQVDDIRMLVDIIWHKHSILSKCDDIKKLRLPRWIVGDDWAPWNCVCLTEVEARNHNKLKDLTLVYDKTLIQEIEHRHRQARSSFRPLAAIDCEFVETGQWFKVGLNKQRSVDKRHIFKEVLASKDIVKY